MHTNKCKQNCLKKKMLRHIVLSIKTANRKHRNIQRRHHIVMICEFTKCIKLCNNPTNGIYSVIICSLAIDQYIHTQETLYTCAFDQCLIVSYKIIDMYIAIEYVYMCTSVHVHSYTLYMYKYIENISMIN